MCSLENGNNENHQPLFDCLAKTHNSEMATFFRGISLHQHSLKPSIGGAPYFPRSLSVCQKGEFSTQMGTRDRRYHGGKKPQ